MTNYDLILEQAAADTFWMPDTVEVRDRPEIRYTVSSKPVEFYNRVLFSRGNAAEHDPLISEVTAAHSHTASSWTLTPQNDTPGLRRALEASGYSEGDRHFGYVLRCDDYNRSGPAGITVSEVATRQDLRQLYTVQNLGFGTERTLTDEELDFEVGFCTGPKRRVVRFVARRDNLPVGSGSMTVFPDLQFAMIWAGCVIPEARGHGVYTSLLSARVEVAKALGFTALGLYAKVDTSAPIVAAQGFERFGLMTHYEREKP